MSADYYAYIAGSIADAGGDWPCCSHCDHDPGVLHDEPCFTCDEGGRA